MYTPQFRRTRCGRLAPLLLSAVALLPTSAALAGERDVCMPVELDAIDDFGYGAPIYPTPQMTVEFWAKLDTSGNYGVLTQMGTSGNRAFQANFVRSLPGEPTYLRFMVSDAGCDTGRAWFNFSQQIPIGSWHHYAITFDVNVTYPAPHAIGYFDGVAMTHTNATDPITSVCTTSGTNFLLGAGRDLSINTVNTFFDGQLDDVRIWNDLRTPTEIANNRLTELFANEQGLVHYFKMDANFNDSRSQHNLTINGGPIFPATCVVTTVCGNGIVEGLEECDDGNLLNGDGCASNCTIEYIYNGEPGSYDMTPACVEYAVGNTSEAAFAGSFSFKSTPDPWHRPTMGIYCDSGRRDLLAGQDFLDFYFRAASAANPPTNQKFRVLTWNGVSNEVSIKAFIAGNVIDDTWRRVSIPLGALSTPTYDLSSVDYLQWGTDNGWANGFVDNVRVRNIATACGNAVVEGAEQCDDGNVVGLDGCSSTCVYECGNAIIQGTEACDDGNRVSGDGCSSSCAIESVCGNGIREGSETCDDGNLVSGDGCSSTCTVEALYDGEPGSAPLADNCAVNAVANSAEAAYTGSYSFKTTPTPWHNPTMRLYCSTGVRKNFSASSTIKFYFRAADPANPPTGQSFRITTWNGASNWVSIATHIQGGVIDGTWRLVTIPIVELQTATYNLSSVDDLEWSPVSTWAAGYVDNIVVR